nr:MULTISPECIES: ATP-dependent DNA ligase [Cryobacterium]
MGMLTYGNGKIEVEFDDRTLAHLQLVIIAKLRRRESFVFTWTNSKIVGHGRTSIWIDPSIPLQFQYLGNRSPTINRSWVDALMDSANSSSGLILTNEQPVCPGGIRTLVTTQPLPRTGPTSA